MFCTCTREPKGRENHLSSKTCKNDFRKSLQNAYIDNTFLIKAQLSRKQLTMPPDNTRSQDN
eukprot:2765544-Amphidinium_carterae.1